MSPEELIDAPDMDVSLKWNNQSERGWPEAGYSARITDNLIWSVTKTAPGIFRYSGNRAVATNQDNALNAPDDPAKAGSFISVYMTGQGALDNAIANGATGVCFTPALA
jgi:uncharacterized protein (TIGR03437 family)